MMAIPGSSTGAAPVAAPPPAAPAAVPLPAVTVSVVTWLAVYAPEVEVRRNGSRSRQIMRRHVGMAKLVVTERKEQGR